MSWEAKAHDEAKRQDHADSDWYAREATWLFMDGARWQRSALRTDEAVERVAEQLYRDEYQHPMSEHDTWCQIEDCTNAEDFRDQARAAITALIGEDP